VILELHAADPIAFGVHDQTYDECFETPDSVALRAGLHAIGESWRHIDREAAEAVLRFILSHDLAFSSLRLPEPTVLDVIQDFIGRFSLSAQFYTNGSWAEGYRSAPNTTTSFGPEWQPLTDATFDGGVVALDSERAGLLWIEDED
jgi:hypothetical protein